MMTSTAFANRLGKRVAPMLRTLAQIGALILVWLMAAALVDVLSLPVSAGVVGLLLVLVLLLSGLVPVELVRLGADWMLGELVLFFIPAVVAVVEYGDLFRREGVALVGAVALGTVLVMISTAWAVRFGCGLEHRLVRRARYRRWRHLRHHQPGRGA